METTAEFDIRMTPVDGLLDGTGRFDFTKTWRGGVDCTGQGVMLSGGQPDQGEAGYVALETFAGSIDGRSGTVTLQQFGSMTPAGQELRYELVPGSGTGDLAGIAGTVELTIVDGMHTVRLDYTLPD